jgi:hypothetical protein
MTELILQDEQILEHLYFLRPAFTQQGFRHGLAYINGLIFSYKKTIKKITTNDANYSLHSGIQRLLNSLKVDVENLQQKYFSKIKWLLKGEISLIFDDFLVEREGKHVELTQNHKDHVSNGYVTGHQFFTAMLVAENVALPLFPQVFHKNSQSKIEMAKELVKFVGSKFTVANVMFDSWYSDKKLIRVSSFFDEEAEKSFYIDESQYEIQE